MLKVNYWNDATEDYIPSKFYTNWYNWLGYASLDNQWLKNYMTVDTIIIDQLSNGSARIVFHFGKSFAVCQWASYSVAVEFFTKRSYRFSSYESKTIATRTAIFLS